MSKPIKCRFGKHEPGWAFVGSSWHPDLYVKICVRCQDELPTEPGELNPYEQAQGKQEKTR